MFFLRFIIAEKIRLCELFLNWIPIHKGASRSEGPLSSRLAKMMIDYVKPEVVSWSPRIIVLYNFLSSEECEYLKAIARPRLQVSTVVDIKTGKGVKSDVRTSSGILDLYNTRADLRKKDHLAIDKYALRGLRSLAVARQTVPEKTKKKSSGDPWEFVGGLPLFDPPRHDSAYIIRKKSLRPLCQHQ
ncbi:hypothetical protein Bca52824_073727 [Brassica carinata]|uniref:Uncharacterized protein n=1 Tax=Brassica carinata TaxID=52824 RepID=A0A8X7QB46_BRACI|nr:hypothetical protein Bca52824_073727 [Brassica carinata]